MAAPVRQAEEVRHVGLHRFHDVQRGRGAAGLEEVGTVGGLQALPHVAVDEVLKRRHEGGQLMEVKATALLPLLDERLEVQGHLAAQSLTGGRGCLGLAHRVQAADIPSVPPNKVLVQGVAHCGVVQAARLAFGQALEEATKALLELRQAGRGDAAMGACQRGLDLLEQGALEALRVGSRAFCGVVGRGGCDNRARQSSYCADPWSEALRRALCVLVVLRHILAPTGEPHWPGLGAHDRLCRRHLQRGLGEGQGIKDSVVSCHWRSLCCCRCVPQNCPGARCERALALHQVESLHLVRLHEVHDVGLGQGHLMVRGGACRGDSRGDKEERAKGHRTAGG
mmetsp:Transcript_65910/g.175530  ORF Transcript_65910/g.175530 Transcript_65910/m.175530 type:complete len:339 (-) Transcript_65910:67-1083(-)